MSIFSGVKKKLERIAMGKITSMVLVKAAQGDFGPVIKRVYWALRGKKSWIALGFALAAGALVYGDRSGTCSAVGWAWCGTWGEHLTEAMAVVSFYFGQVDGALHSDAPEKE